MKRSVLLLALVTALLLNAFAVAAQPGITVADILATFAESDHPEFTHLAKALQTADPKVRSLLDNPNVSVTLFAPTDAAFEAIRQTRYGAATLRLLLDDHDLVTNVLEYHLAFGGYRNSDLISIAKTVGKSGGSLQTVQGQHLHITLGSDERFVIDNEASPILDAVEITFTRGNESLTFGGTELTAVNGVIHVMDTVLVPNTETILQTIQDSHVELEGEFSTLATALAAADPAVISRLADPEAETTLLAPTDAAFTVLGKDALATALANPQALTDLLNYHLIQGRLSSNEIKSRIGNDGQAVIITELGGLLDSTAVTFSMNPDGFNQLLVNGGAKVLAGDVDASNGIIHVIDAVLQPPQ